MDYKTYGGCRLPAKAQGRRKADRAGNIARISDYRKSYALIGRSDLDRRRRGLPRAKAGLQLRPYLTNIATKTNPMTTSAQLAIST
jgi:hypothetical protein